MHHSFYHSTTSTTTPTHSSQAPTQTSLPDPVIPRPINYEYPFAHHPPLILLIARTPPTTPPTSPSIQPPLSHLPAYIPTSLPQNNYTGHHHLTQPHATALTPLRPPNPMSTDPTPSPQTQHCPTLLQLPLRSHTYPTQLTPQPHHHHPHPPILTPSPPPIHQPTHRTLTYPILHFH